MAFGVTIVGSRDRFEGLGEVGVFHLQPPVPASVFLRQNALGGAPGPTISAVNAAAV